MGLGFGLGLGLGLGRFTVTSTNPNPYPRFVQKFLPHHKTEQHEVTLNEEPVTPGEASPRRISALRLHACCL